MTVDVVIPVGPSDTPKPALLSLARQTFQDFSIILSHDTDRRGANWARNQGFRLATSEFVLFSDCDVSWVDTALDTLVRELRESPSHAFAYGWYIMDGETHGRRAYDPVLLRKRNFITTMSLVRRELFCGFDETLRRLQDWDVWLTMLEQNKTGRFVDMMMFTTKKRDGITFGPSAQPWNVARDIVVRKHKI